MTEPSVKRLTREQLEEFVSDIQAYWSADEINGPDAVDFVAQRLEHFGLYIDADAHAPCLVCGVPSDERGVCREEGCPGNPATD